MRSILDRPKESKLKFASLDKLKLPWYFETFFEKLIVVLGTLSLFYSILRIVFQGVW